MGPVSLTILFRAPTARFPACTNAESSTYHDLDTGVGLSLLVGTYTGCMLAARATEITMSGTGAQLSGPSLVPWPVPMFLPVRAFHPHCQQNAKSNPSCGYR